MFFLVLALIMALMAVVFALANTETVPISILVQQFPSVPIALVVLISVILGILIAFFGLLPSLIRNKMYISGQRKKINALEKNVAEKQGKVEQLELKLNPPAIAPANPTLSANVPAETSDNTIDPVI